MSPRRDLACIILTCPDDLSESMVSPRTNLGRDLPGRSPTGGDALRSPAKTNWSERLVSRGDRHGGGEMRAVTVEPGTPGSLRVEDVPEPDPAMGSIVVEALAVGICGTDAEIAAGGYGWAPPGRKRLILGHESLGRVVDPGRSGFEVGEHVVGIVRSRIRGRARTARWASGTCAPTVATPNVASSRSTASLREFTFFRNDGRAVVSILRVRRQPFYGLHIWQSPRAGGDERCVLR